MLPETPPPAPPAGIGAYLIQITGPDREALLDYAVARGHGVEVADFAESALLDDPAGLDTVLAWYARRLPEVRGPLSLHGPYHNLAPGGLDGRIRAATQERVAQCLDIAGELGIGRVVFHSDFDLVPTPGHLAAWVARAAGFWQEAIAGRGIELLLENAFEPDPAVLLALLQAIGRPQAGVCLDVGHAHLMSALWGRATGQSSWPSTADWLAALAGHVRYLHLSDNDGSWDQHLPPGRGTIPWPTLLARLAGLPSPLPAVLEVTGVPAAQEAEASLASLA